MEQKIKIGFTPKGEYNSDSTYDYLDIVTLDNRVYASLIDTNEENYPENSPESWQLLVEGIKGEKGEAGAAGAAGAKGEKGEKGDRGEQGPQFALTCKEEEADDNEATAVYLKKGVLHYVDTKIMETELIIFRPYSDVTTEMTFQSTRENRNGGEIFPYFCEIYMNETAELPGIEFEDALWHNNKIPSFKAGCRYVIMVLNGIAKIISTNDTTIKDKEEQQATAEPTPSGGTSGAASGRTVVIEDMTLADGNEYTIKEIYLQADKYHIIDCSLGNAQEIYIFGGSGLDDGDKFDSYMCEIRTSTYGGQAPRITFQGADFQKGISPKFEKDRTYIIEVINTLGIVRYISEAETGIGIADK